MSPSLSENFRLDSIEKEVLRSRIIVKYKTMQLERLLEDDYDNFSSHGNEKDRELYLKVLCYNILFTIDKLITMAKDAK